MTKSNQKTATPNFQPKFTKDAVASFKKDPNRVYKVVIYTYDHDPERVQRYLDMGWEVVTSTSTIPSEGSLLIKDQENLVTPSPVQKHFRKGHSGVLMSISKDQWTQNVKIREKERMERYLASANRKTKRQGNNLIITESDINLDENN